MLIKLITIFKRKKTRYDISFFNVCMLKKEIILELTILCTCSVTMCSETVLIYLKVENFNFNETWIVEHHIPVFVNPMAGFGYRQLQYVVKF